MLASPLEWKAFMIHESEQYRGNESFVLPRKDGMSTWCHPWVSGRMHSPPPFNCPHIFYSLLRQGVEATCLLLYSELRQIVQLGLMRFLVICCKKKTKNNNSCIKEHKRTKYIWRCYATTSLQLTYSLPQLTNACRCSCHPTTVLVSMQ